MKDPNYAPVCCALYPGLAKITREHGYALAIHGTLGRDMDLICVLWVENPSKPQAVVDAITNEYALTQTSGWTTKLHNRLVTIISVSFGECYIDLSFMPVTQYKPMVLCSDSKVTTEQVRLCSCTNEPEAHGYADGCFRWNSCYYCDNGWFPCNQRCIAD